MIALTFPLLCVAQHIKLAEASRQNWSGGIAGSSGSHCLFVFEFSSYDKVPVPEAIWIENKEYKIIANDSTGRNNTTVKLSAGGKKVSYETRIETNNRRRFMPGGKAAENQQPPVAVKGAALLVYKYKGKDTYYTIKKILHELPPLNYP